MFTIFWKLGIEDKKKKITTTKDRETDQIESAES